jgi:hypothetical protein
MWEAVRVPPSKAGPRGYCSEECAGAARVAAAEARLAGLKGWAEKVEQAAL